MIAWRCPCDRRHLRLRVTGRNTGFVMGSLFVIICRGGDAAIEIRVVAIPPPQNRRYTTLRSALGYYLPLSLLLLSCLLACVLALF